MWLLVLLLRILQSACEKKFCAQGIFEEPFQNQTLQLRPLGLPLSSKEVHLCSLEIRYDHGYCTINADNGVNDVVAGFVSFPKEFQDAGDFCAISSTSTICFCSNSCNARTASIVHALQNSYDMKYEAAYRQYNDAFIPSDETDRLRILDCLIKEFGGEDMIRDTRSRHTRAHRFRDPLEFKRREEKRRIFKRDLSAEPSRVEDEDEALMKQIVFGGGAVPFIMLAISYIILNHMEKSKTGEDGEEQDGDEKASEGGTESKSISGASTPVPALNVKPLKGAPGAAAPSTPKMPGSAQPAKTPTATAKKGKTTLKKGKKTKPKKGKGAKAKKSKKAKKAKKTKKRGKKKK